jgi:hypothetical protein
MPSSYKLTEFRKLVSKIVKEEVEQAEECKDCPGCEKCEPEETFKEGVKKFTLKQLRSEISEAIREHYGMDADDVVVKKDGKFKTFDQEDDVKPWNSDYGQCEFCGKQFIQPGEQEEHKAECSVDNYGYGNVGRGAVSGDPQELKFESEDMCDEEDDICDKEEKPLKESFDFKAFITEFRDSTKKSLL